VGRIVRANFLLQALLVTFMWSASKIVIKIGLGSISPFILIGLVSGVSFLFLFIYTIMIRAEKKRVVVDKGLTGLLAISGVVGFAAAPLFSTIGLKFISGSTAGIFAALSPVLVVILSSLIVRESPKVVQWVGVLVALVGTYIFLSHDFFSATFFGILMLFLAELGYALEGVLNRYMLDLGNGNPVMMTLIQNGIGAAILVPVGLGVDGVPILNLRLVLIIVFLGIIFAFGGLMWNHVLNVLKAYEAAIFQNTMIVQISVLSFFYLGESITQVNIIGMVVVIVGALLVALPVIRGPDRHKLEISKSPG